ncbi:MAG: hypothetical protein EHM79_00215 [Geobacter sp.]|nr:MAG: hypothetical protein EHM79_00215 [Geobacter sp.]
MPLVPLVELQRIQSIYDADLKKDKVTTLLQGEFGTGKTRFADTCPAPVLCHMFDPHGEQTLRRGISEGRIIVDNSFEYRKWRGRPGDLFNKWTTLMSTYEREGFFNNIGTYFIDSFTTFSIALLSSVSNDWQKWSDTLREIVDSLMGLPCHVVLTSHIEIIRNDVTGVASAYMYTPGRVKFWIPGLFSEVYVLRIQGGGDNAKYELLTRNDGYYKARTRMGADGLFKAVEVPDFKELLKKAGYPYEDKPLMKELLKTNSDTTNQTNQTKKE